MELLEGEELEKFLAQWESFEAKKAEVINEAFQREIVTGDDIKSVLLTYSDSNNRWELFANLAENGKLSDEAFNVGLAIAWVEGKGTGDYRAISYFMKCKKEIIMDEKELVYYDSLPDKVTLYRGCSMEEYEDDAFGISWTTNREVAEFFAFRCEQEGTAVYSMEVDKNDIRAVFLSRNEFEAIYLDSYEVTLVTDKPTELYNNYMIKKRQQDKLRIGIK